MYLLDDGVLVKPTPPIGLIYLIPKVWGVQTRLLLLPVSFRTSSATKIVLPDEGFAVAAVASIDVAPTASSPLSSAAAATVTNFRP